MKEPLSSAFVDVAAPQCSHRFLSLSLSLSLSTLYAFPSANANIYLHTQTQMYIYIYIYTYNVYVCISVTRVRAHIVQFTSGLGEQKRKSSSCSQNIDTQDLSSISRSRGEAADEPCVYHCCTALSVVIAIIGTDEGREEVSPPPSPFSFPLYAVVPAKSASTPDDDARLNNAFIGRWPSLRSNKKPPSSLSLSLSLSPLCYLTDCCLERLSLLYGVLYRASFCKQQTRKLLYSSIYIQPRHAVTQVILFASVARTRLCAAITRLESIRRAIRIYTRRTHGGGGG